MYLSLNFDFNVKFLANHIAQMGESQRFDIPVSIFENSSCGTSIYPEALDMYVAIQCIYM